MPKANIPRITRLLPFMALILAYTLLFFVLRGKVLFTPDFDRSDAFHLNVSLKYFLWQTLHQNTLPFWTQQLQGGFPLLAEGQIGALYLPNLIFYRLFSFTDAYMLSFIGSLFLFALGMYLLLLKQKIRKPLALLMGLSGAFAGFITYRWVHLNLIQTVSLFPFLFLSAEYAYYSRSARAWAIHIFLIAETVFAGHVQVAFLGFLSLVLWYMANMLHDKKSISYTVWKTVRSMTPVFFLGFLLALPQILPTLQLMQYSGRSQQSGYNFATSYSFSLRHVVSFITPYFYGNPKYHTYPLTISQWGVFWENTPYIGELLCIAITAAIVYLIVKKRFFQHKGFVLLALSASFLIISFGSNSPLYFIFDLPPFSLFRTPAKYLIPSSFFLLWGGSLLIEDVLGKVHLRMVHIGMYVALTVNIVILVITAFSYHVFIDGKSVLSRNSVTYPLQSRDRYLTYGFGDKWSEYLGQHGWEKPKDIMKYEAFDSALIPNSNFIYGGECFDINTGGLRLRRVDTVNRLLMNFFAASDSAQTATRSAMNLVTVANINAFVSTESLPILSSYSYISMKDTYGLYHYRRENLSPGYYLPKRIYSAVYADDFDALYSEGRVSTSEAVIEGYHSALFTGNPQVQVIKNTDSEFFAKASAPEEFYFVLGKNWYPEWRVLIDGKETKPMKTNLIHMGFIVPSGSHTISASYVPYSFYTGIFGAAIGVCLLGFLYLRRSTDRR